MKKNLKKILVLGALAFVVSGIIAAFCTHASASAVANCTSVLPDSWCQDVNGSDGWENFIKIVKTIVRVITAGMIVFAAVGIAICGFIWMNARDNEAQVTIAKRRIFDIVLGLVIWILFAIFAQLLLPDDSGIKEWVTTYENSSLISGVDNEKQA